MIDTKKIQDFLVRECIANKGGIVYQKADCLMSVIEPNDAKTFANLSNFKLKFVSVEDAKDLGYDELADWSTPEDTLIYCDDGIIFNVGNTPQDTFVI